MTAYRVIPLLIMGRPPPVPSPHPQSSQSLILLILTERANPAEGHPGILTTMPAARKPKIDVPTLIERLESVYGRPRQIARFDPMEELISCILSQHTSDANSFPTFTRLRETYPDWQAIVDAGTEQVADTIRQAGLANQKSKSIVGALTEIKKRNGDYELDSLRKIPMLEARDWLMSLPGVGPKTASIVLCFSLGMGAIPVDTHVYRVSWRLGLIDEDLGENKAHDALLKLVPPEYAFRYHVALIQHGRHTCKAPLPDCEPCVVKNLCAWYAEGGPLKRRKELEARRKKAKPSAPKRNSPRQSIG